MSEQAIHDKISATREKLFRWIWLAFGASTAVAVFLFWLNSGAISSHLEKGGHDLMDTRMTVQETLYNQHVVDSAKRADKLQATVEAIQKTVNKLAVKQGIEPYASGERRRNGG